MNTLHVLSMFKKIPISLFLCKKLHIINAYLILSKRNYCFYFMTFIFFVYNFYKYRKYIFIDNKLFTDNIFSSIIYITNRLRVSTRFFFGLFYKIIDLIMYLFDNIVLIHFYIFFVYLTFLYILAYNPK